MLSLHNKDKLLFINKNHNDHNKLLVARLSEAERRYIRILALREGLTLREAILQAFHVWEAQLDSKAADVEPSTPPSLGRQKVAEGGAPTSTPQPKAAATERRQRRPAEARPATKPSAPSAPPAPAPAWLERAPQLDWSKCSEAELLRGETGNRWVVRGTDAPLPRVLQSLADGHPPAEIIASFGITPLQLLTILQFASEGAPAGLTTETQRTRS